MKINKINRLTMRQLGKVLLAIDNAHTIIEMALDCGTGLGEGTYHA